MSTFPAPRPRSRPRVSRLAAGAGLLVLLGALPLLPLRGAPGPEAASAPANLPGAATAVVADAPDGMKRALASSPGETVPDPDEGLEQLRRELERLAAESGGVMGVGVHHLETGRELYLRGDESFPMASTYKVPIAVQLLTRVERGQVDLDSLVEIRPHHLHPGSGTLTPLFDDPGVFLSLRNLVELMLQISDNSGTDLVLDAAGGPSAVTDRMHRAGFEGIRVDRSTLRLIADYLGIGELPIREELSPETFEALVDSLLEEERETAAESFAADPRDTATPRDMARLLSAIWNHELLSEESSSLLLDIMRRCRTGDYRLKGMLPPETVVAHKTGTIGGTTNDVGIIELPDGRGHVIVAAFVRESDRDVEEREDAIAQVARAVYDYFLFTTGDVAERSLPELSPPWSRTEAR